MVPQLRATCAALLTALVLVGCTYTETGAAQPGNTLSQPGKVSSQATGTSSTAPPRPKTIKVDGVEPCDLLTPDQMKALKVFEKERNDSDIVKAGPVPTCEFDGSLKNHYGIAVITIVGVEYWRPGGFNLDISPVTISGFPARQLSLTGVEFDCAVAVDVADGQQLYVDTLPIGDKPPKEVMCANVNKAAEFALATLEKLKG